MDISSELELRERYFGMGTPFDYLMCARCDSLYIKDLDFDLQPYYPDTYYSYAAKDRGGILGYIDKEAFLALARRHVSMVREAGTEVSGNSAILDIGSGAGHLLKALHRLGYSEAFGIDPYLSPEIETGEVTVLRTTLESYAEETAHVAKADLIMFHHALEHLPHPAATLEIASRLLTRQGAILVRIPVLSYAWKKYREYCFSLDAPRHLAIPTVAGMEAAANQVGLEISRVRFDSTSIQFLASEAYLRGESYVQAFRPSPPRTLLRMITSVGDQFRARRLNALQQGDQAAFVLRRKM